jgi:hypothetical protein
MSGQSEPFKGVDVEFTTKLCVTPDRIQGLLVSAFEGGSNYWYEKAGVDYGGMTRDDFMSHVRGWTASLIDLGAEDMWHGYYAPFVPGCATTLYVHDDPDVPGPVRLDLDAIKRGIDLMAHNTPHHWTTFVEENEDADTGDAFLQLCLFGEIRYA